MKKCLFSGVLWFAMLLILIPSAVFASAAIPQSIDAPTHVAVSVSPDGDGNFSYYEIGFTATDNVVLFTTDSDAWYADNLMGNLSIFGEFDYKYNESGSWHHDASWDTAENAPDPFNCGYLPEISADYPNSLMYINPESLSPVVNNSSMLKDNTLFFRMRIVISYYDANGEKVKLITPWSETIAIGKNAGQEEITVEAPVLSEAELKQDAHTNAPYIEVTNQIPESVKALDNTVGTVKISVEVRINNSTWKAQTGFAHLQNVFTVTPENVGLDSDIQINAGTYELRARYAYDAPGGDPNVDAWSPYSNIVKINMPAFYNGASAWAVPELDKAAEYGLITDRIKDNVAGNITREEFAEIAVRLYEIYTGLKAQTGSISFSDTSNPEILKAANLGLVLGVGEGKYAPNQLVTREQMATIMLRALKVLNPGEDYSTAGAAKFSDDNLIESWARDGVYYCSKAGILKGTGNNMFDPDGNSTREAAVIVCTRSYEYFKSDVKSGEAASDMSGSSPSAQESDAEINQFLIGKWSFVTPGGTFFYHFKEDKTLEVSKENDSTGGHLSFFYEVLNNELTVFYYGHTEFTVTEDGITEPVYSNKQIYQQCVISKVDNDTLSMDGVQIVRVQ